MPKPKRVNKTKAQLEEDMLVRQETDRKRQRVRDELYPLLMELGETIRYVKIFLHTASVAADTAFLDKKKEIKLKDLDILKMFNKDDEKTAHYTRLYELFGDESVQSFMDMVQTMPQNIDNMLYFETEKKPFSDINIDDLLGK